MGTIKSIKVNGLSYSLDNSGVTTSVDSSVDFAIADEAGNKAFVLYKGHIITKNFDSRVSSQETANNIRVEGTKLIIE